MVIQAARRDESTATSSSNYFAVNTHGIVFRLSDKSYPCDVRRFAVSRRVSERIVELW